MKYWCRGITVLGSDKLGCNVNVNPNLRPAVSCIVREYKVEEMTLVSWLAHSENDLPQEPIR